MRHRIGDNSWDRSWGDTDCSIRDAAEVVGEAVVGCVEAQHSRALGARTRAPCPSSANTDDLPSVVHGHSLISRRATASAGWSGGGRRFESVRAPEVIASLDAVAVL